MCSSFNRPDASELFARYGLVLREVQAIAFALSIAQTRVSLFAPLFSDSAASPDVSKLSIAKTRASLFPYRFIAICLEPSPDLSIAGARRKWLSPVDVTGGEVTGYARIKNQIGGNPA